MHKTDENSSDLVDNPFPNGWIPVLQSRDIRKYEVKTIIAFGQELVAFRGSSGQIYIMDALCPHLGANIGVGGNVVEEMGQNCISCPFHGWTFSGKDGLCIKIPELKSYSYNK